jgi:DNA-binding CsgD family transcriptional regulator
MEHLAQSEYQLAVQLRNHQAKGVAVAGLGWVALMRGELGPSVLRYREAVASLSGIAATGVRREAWNGLVEALAVSGDASGAAAALAVALAEPSAEGWRSENGELPLLDTARAWATAAEGEMSRALFELASTAESARSSGQVASELAALGAMVRLGSTRVAGRLAELAGWVQGPLVGVVAAHAAALGRGRGSGDALDDAADAYGALGLQLYAAETAAQASRAHTITGLRRKAAASAARAHGFLAGGEGPRPLGLVIALAPPTLTSREREVAMLAQSGLSSQAIAARLHLSVRTVESHLARVYYKLGIGSRSDLEKVLSFETVEASAG